jgi:hypothetical protein
MAATKPKESEVEKERKAEEKAAEKADKELAKVEKPQPLTDQSTTIPGVYPGSRVKIVSGDYEGKVGAITDDLPGTDNVLVRTRDDDSARLVVEFTDLRPDDAGQR